ncbi:MAG: hypothetical protein RQ847_01145 [Wenzhouxiangellaceae bacterium]|nr:hypothetical protein [Wenzhouxiangellaceae bacterium]
MCKDIVKLASRSCLLTLLLLGFASAQAQEMQPEPAIQAPLADESLLLDVIEYNDSGYVAVGARGHVLLSEDGRQWKQAGNVPLQATLTRATHFGRRLWAVGHDASIISSMDGGETWFIQYRDPEGDDLAPPEAQGPLLDVLFLNPNEGIAIGAYGRYMTTDDGGIHWNPGRIADRVASEAIDWEAMARRQGGYETLPEDFEMPGGSSLLDMLDKGCYQYNECHLNAILRLSDGRLMIAAERGYGFRSEDDGKTWEAFRFPYPGSMFGLVKRGGCVIAFGLRGHIQRSCDFGTTWEAIETGSEQTLMGGDVDAQGRVFLVGAGATRITIGPNGEIESEADLLGSDYAAVVVGGDEMILVGDNGVRHD